MLRVPLPPKFTRVTFEGIEEPVTRTQIELVERHFIHGCHDLPSNKSASPSPLMPIVTIVVVDAHNSSKKYEPSHFS
jgi:hypothetical protein